MWATLYNGNRLVCNCLNACEVQLELKIRSLIAKSQHQSALPLPGCVSLTPTVTHEPLVRRMNE